MIVYYTKYNVKDTFDKEKMLNLAFASVSGMKNVPEEFKNIVWDGTSSFEKKRERNVLAYEIDVEGRIVAFRVAIVDTNDEIWTTDIAFREKEHIIQLRLAREKAIASAEYTSRFHVPYVFKKIIRDGHGGIDVDLQVSDKPIVICSESIFCQSSMFLIRFTVKTIW